MRAFLIICMALGVLWQSVSYAEPFHGKDYSYFEDQIEQKIAACHRKGNFIYSRSSNLKLYGAIALDKARFFSLSKDKLIRDMISSGITRKKHAIDYYLICSFTPGVNHLSAKITQ